MDDTTDDNSMPTQGPNINLNIGFNPAGDQTQTSSKTEEISESYSGSGIKEGGNILKIIIGVISGLLVVGGLIWFFISLIISQSNIQTEIGNTKSTVQAFETNFDYHKNAVENRFDDIDEKLEDLEDEIENIKP